MSRFILLILLTFVDFFILILKIQGLPRKISGYIQYRHSMTNNTSQGVQSTNKNKRKENKS